VTASISLREVTRDNWRAALGLAVHADQQRFVADHAPIAAIVLAKAYIRPDDMVWAPYAIYANAEMVGMAALAYQPGGAAECWLYHFFIDQSHQGRGFGTAGLQAFIELVQAQHPHCRQINLTVHPANRPAQRLYASAGFRPTGRERFGEPVYTLHVSR
jgi:diamine N-acetyltransferase